MLSGIQEEAKIGSQLLGRSDETGDAHMFFIPLLLMLLLRYRAPFFAVRVMHTYFKIQITQRKCVCHGNLISRKRLDAALPSGDRFSHPADDRGRTLAVFGPPWKD